MNPQPIAGLRAGRSGIEDVPDAAVATPALSFTDDPTDLEGCQTYVLAFRPLCGRDARPGCGRVESATRTVAASLRPGDLAGQHGSCLLRRA